MKSVCLVTSIEIAGKEEEDTILKNAFRAAGLRSEILSWESLTSDFSGFDLVIIRTTWNYTRRLNEFLEWVETVASKTVLINDQKLIFWNFDKKYLTELSASNVETIHTEWISPEDVGNLKEIVNKLCSERGVDQFVVKPSVGAGGRTMMKFGLNEVIPAIEWIKKVEFSSDVMLQAFEPLFVEKGEKSAILFGGELSHTIQKVPKGKEFRVQRQYGGNEEVVSLRPDEMQFVNSVCEAAPFIPDIARVDFIDAGEEHQILVELEVIEPRLFFDILPEKADSFVDYIIKSKL